MGASIPAFSCRAILLLLLKGGLRFRQTPRAARMCSGGGVPQRTFLNRGSGHRAALCGLCHTLSDGPVLRAAGGEGTLNGTMRRRQQVGADSETLPHPESVSLTRRPKKKPRLGLKPRLLGD